jgi:nucleoside-diphosphate-sugar epimerase
LKKTKILITGGTGFIGYHFAKNCIKKNWIVESLSTKKPTLSRRLKNVRYLICDVSHFQKLKKKLSKSYDYVVNFAGYVDHSNKAKTMKSHYLGAQNLAKIFLNSKIKKFIQIGSSIEYGKKTSPQSEEIDNQKVFSFYGNAKLLATKMFLKLYKENNFPVSIIRLYLVYGPNQEPNRLIPITILNALKKNNFSCSHGNQLRDFIHVNDVVRSIFKILNYKESSGEIFNIGSGKGVKVKKVIKRICKIIGSGKPQFGKIKIRKDEISKLYPNISKAKKILRWEPKIKLNVGLKKTINYYIDEKSFK